MVARDEIERRLARFQEACRQQGLKVTHQRTEVFRELAKTEEHPGAETIYKRVRKRIPALSLDTVYRTLRTLEDQGVIGRVGSGHDRIRFDANTDKHHHFVCTRCGAVRDFYSDELSALQAPPQAADMGEVDDVYIELRGVCRRCQGAERNRT